MVFHPLAYLLLAYPVLLHDALDADGFIGCLLVIRAALVRVLAVEFGFLTVMIGAAVAYAVILGPVYPLRAG